MIGSLQQWWLGARACFNAAVPIDVMPIMLLLNSY